jgi:hypothetical protein
MADEIRFNQKKVDESWKDQVGKEKSAVQPVAASSSKPKAPSKTSQPFLGLLSSLGYQAMMALGEMPGAPGQEPDLGAAKELIDLLIAIREKTSGNLSAEELQVFENLLPELQMKFAQKA